jgi:hypothetical protein
MSRGVQNDGSGYDDRGGAMGGTRYFVATADTPLRRGLTRSI